MMEDLNNTASKTSMTSSHYGFYHDNDDTFIYLCTYGCSSPLQKYNGGSQEPRLFFTTAEVQWGLSGALAVLHHCRSTMGAPRKPGYSSPLQKYNGGSQDPLTHRLHYHLTTS
ncbi:hypothetical protein OTU49_011262 [Cherax quadricarinatus]|uniref:Uncharacterized protein n=1 Tax=Cherax quadricarinatus TaxID=27406 RepID=A0AAW0W3Z2_CHEQU